MTIYKTETPKLTTIATIVMSALVLVGCASNKKEPETGITPRQAASEAKKELYAVFERIERQEQLLKEVEASVKRGGYHYISADSQMIPMNDIAPLSPHSVQKIVETGKDPRQINPYTNLEAVDGEAYSVPIYKNQSKEYQMSQENISSANGESRRVMRRVPLNLIQKPQIPTAKPESIQQPVQQSASKVGKAPNSSAAQDAEARNILFEPISIPIGEQVHVTKLLKSVAKAVGFQFELIGEDADYHVKFESFDGSAFKLMKAIGGKDGLNDKIHINVKTKGERKISVEYK